MTTHTYIVNKTTRICIRINGYINMLDYLYNFNLFYRKIIVGLESPKILIHIYI